MRQLKYLSNTYTEKEKPITQYPEQLINYLLNKINISPPFTFQSKVLDVGCGRGDQLKIFEKLNFDTYGIDLEKSNYLDLKNFKQVDFAKEKFPFEDNFFDIVFTKSVIEHLYLEGIENFMLEIKRILKPDGFFIILTPSWEYNVKTFYNEFTHVTPFTKRSLEQCVKGYSLKIVSIDYLIQLPFVWKFTSLKFLCDLINLINLPRKWGKIFRWSQDRVLLCISKK